VAAVWRAKTAWTGLGRPASVALVIAGVWGLGLVVAGFVVPMYRTMTESTSGEVARGTDTLVGANGLGVVVVLAVPFVVTVLVGCALLLRAHRGALPVSWTLTGLLAVLTLLSMPSIGLFIIPITACLAVACATSHPQPGQLGPISGSSVAP
jgi:hypothetical protein